MPEVTDKYIRIPVARRKQGDRIRTITISSSKGIKALYAGNRKKILTYLFLRSKGWTMPKAKKWVKEHHNKNKSINFMKTKKSNQQEATRFSFAIPIVKCYEEVTKGEDGKEVKKRYIEGIASSTDIDLHGDKMAPSAIKSMANSIKKHKIGLNAEHDKSWQSDLGDVTKLAVDKANKLLMKAELDITSKAKDLWYALTTKKKELGLSIGGFVKDYKLEWDKKKEQFSRIFKDIELDHIAVTSTPANPKTWVGAITKSVEKLEKNSNKELKEILVKECKNMSNKNFDTKALLNFIHFSLSKLDKEEVSELLTNFNETLMLKEKKTSLESDEAKKSKEEKKDEEEKEEETEDENAESETQENEDENKDESEDEESEDDSSKEDEESDDSEDEDSEESEDESEESDDDSKEDDDSKKEDESDEDESEEEEDEEKSKDSKKKKEKEEKSITKEEVKEMIDKGIKNGLRSFFDNLFGNKEAKEEANESEEKTEDEDKEKTEDKSLMKTILANQEKIIKGLNKKKGIRKTVALEKDEKKEADETEEGKTFKTMNEELDATRELHKNDPDKAFSECGKVREKWADK